MSDLASQTQVRWKSRIGYTYEGTVVRGTDADGYELVTGGGAIAVLIPRESIEVLGQDVPTTMTLEERATAAADRGVLIAEAHATDTIMAVAELLRVNAGPDLTVEVGDEFRLQAAQIVEDASVKMAGLLRAVVAEKRERLTQAAEAQPTVEVEPLSPHVDNAVDDHA